MKVYLDKDPHLEYYRCITTFNPDDLVKLYEIILSGKIEKHFWRLK